MPAVRLSDFELVVLSDFVIFEISDSHNAADIRAVPETPSGETLLLKGLSAAGVSQAFSPAIMSDFSRFVY